MTVHAERRGDAGIGRTERARSPRFVVVAHARRTARGLAAAGLLACALAATAAMAQSTPTPPGTPVRNTASASFERAPGLTDTRTSNEVVLTVAPPRTSAAISLLRVLPDPAGASTVGATQCRNAAGTLVALPPPQLLGGTVLDLTRPVAATTERVYHGGEPVFVRVVDRDQNRDATVLDAIEVRLTAAATGDVETLRLIETGPNTGEFTGYAPTRAGTASAGDCTLDVARGSTLLVAYTDASDARDTAQASAVVDPQGTVFDSRTGTAISGAVVRLVDASTGAPAQVLGDDGRSAFPSEVTSGGTATDAGGTQYQFPPGTFRFPVVANAGSYRLVVEPPAGYAFPTQVAESALQALPGAPWVLTPGSFGNDYAVTSPAAVTIDVPLDAIGGPLVLTKTVAVATAAIGDAVQYRVSLANSGPIPVRDVEIVDTLPQGLRYVAGSSRLGTAVLADPVIDASGRGLTYTLAQVDAGATVTLSYVARIGAGAGPGEAVNHAHATGAGRRLSSNDAEAGVLITNDLFRDRGFILGRLVQGACDASQVEGVANVRLYLENGRYVVTDSEGRYHFEDLKAGTHVVQIDATTVPDGLEPVSCGAAASRSDPTAQMIELRAGGLWRADFRFRTRPPVRGAVRLQGESAAEGPLTYRVEVDGVAAKRTRLMLSLPLGASVGEGAVAVDGRAVPASTDDGIVLLTLGDLPAGARRTITVNVAGASEPVRAAALFDAPLQSNARVAPVALTPGVAARSEWSSTETRAVQSLLPVRASAEPHGTVDLALLEKLPSADSLLPGRAWVLPSEGYAPAIPAVHVAIKHAPDEKVSLLVNGAPVSDLARDATVYDARRTLAVSRWRGVSLAEGENKLVAVYSDGEGHELARLERVLHYGGTAVRVELDVAKSTLVADGRTRPVLAVRLYDRFGQPARPGSQGAYRVDPPYRTWWDVESVRTNPIVAVAPRTATYTVEDDGLARIELAPTSQAGNAVLRLQLGEHREQDLRAFLEPAARDWILVGLASGTAAWNDVTSHAEPLPADAPEDGYSDRGRVAFFAKGRVLGSWLLTLGYDSDRDRTRARTRVQGVIDPKQYYTLYGDATETGDDAPSQRKVYVKLERGQFAALFGDFDTGFSVTELTRYSRQLNGVKLDGARGNVKASAFAARTAQDAGRDVLVGDGTSGPYRLSARDLVIGSDRVRLETRERFRSDVVVETKTLQRFLDYDIDYLDGTIFFRRPVPSRDPDLNPVYVVAEYEVVGNGAEHTTAGARATASFVDERVTVGATIVSEGSSTGDRRLGGIDLKARLAPATELKAEAARSHAQDPLQPADGNAWLVELTHVTERVDGSAYLRQQDGSFGLGQQTYTETATRKYGGQGRWRLTDLWSVRGQAYRQEALDRDAERTLAEGEVRWDTGARGVGVGLRTARDRRDGVDENSDQAYANGSYDVLGGRVILKASVEAGLGASSSADFPDRQRVGADWRLNPAYTLFGEYERSQGSAYSSDITRIGVKAQPWAGGQVESALNDAATENGARLYSSLGVTQGFKLDEKWGFDVGLERADTLRGSAPAPLTGPLFGTTPATDFTSTFVGALYRGADWTLSSRLERRESDAENRTIASVGLYREVRAGQAFSMALRLVDTSGGVLGGTSADTRLSWAYRPEGVRYLILDRLDLLYEDSARTESARIVNNLHYNLQLDERTQLGLQFGARFARQTFDSEQYDTYTGLYGVDVRRDLDARWDVGCQATVFDTPAAGTREYSLGCDLGRRFGRQLWVSLGYNGAGFSDRDFSRDRYTARGPYLRFRLHVDQDSLRELVQSWKPGTRP